jgi:hypothetical protein
MNKSLPNHKSWWRRNAKWLFPLILVFITVVYLLASGEVAFGDYAKAYANKGLYKNALQKAQENTRVNEALGTIEPIDRMTIAEGAVEYTDDYTAMTATITLKGSKGKGKMDIAAHKNEGEWQYDKIGVRIKEPKEEIIVYEK